MMQLRSHVFCRSFLHKVIYFNEFVGLSFDLVFVIAILDKAARQQEIKAFACLGCEKSGKYKKLKT